VLEFAGNIQNKNSCIYYNNKYRVFKLATYILAT
jgi:hypothetical protein